MAENSPAAIGTMHSGRANRRRGASCRSRPWTCARFFAQSAAEPDGKTGRETRLRLRMRQPFPIKRQGKNPPMVTIKVENLIEFVAEVFSHADSSREEAK